MRIHRFERVPLNRHLASIPVNENDHIFGSFALNFNCIETREFQEGRKVAADIAVNHILGQRTQGHHCRLAAAWVCRDATDGTVGDDQFILRVIPLRFRSDRIPQQLERKSAPACEQVLHLLCDRFFEEGVIFQIDVQRPPRIAVLHGAFFVGVFA